MSHIHNIAFSSESHPVWIRREICTGENSSKQICCWILMCKTTLFTGGSIIMDYGVVFWPEANKFKVKCLNVGFVSYKHSFLVNWSHVDYCDVFNQLFGLPFCHSDGTHSLQSIHWWANCVMLIFSKSVLMKKQAHLHLGWPEGETTFSKFY